MKKILVIFSLVISLFNTSYAADFLIDPTSTFLRASSGDTTSSPQILDLSTLGLSPGDSITLTQSGEWTAPAPNITTMLGVFSASNILLSDQTLLNRVPGAIDAGSDTVTGTTFSGGLPTDIPEDFLINPTVVIVIPAGATHLFVGAADSQYYDNRDDDNDFSVSILPNFTIGGNVSGLAAGNNVVLQNNAGDDLTINTDGNFTFATVLVDGSSYNVMVLTQPTTPDQTCSIANGSDVIAGSNITNVAVTCSTNLHTVGGSVSGLAAGNSVVLQNNAGDNLTVNADGNYTFATGLANGDSYAVTVLTQPTTPSQTCSVVNGSGVIAGSNITNVAVTCSTNLHTVGGSVSGLAAGNSVVLQNNAGDSLTVNADGNYTFATSLADSSSYAVTVLTQPTTPSQTCSVANGSGVIAGSNITNVAVTCSTNLHTVGGSVSGLATGNSVVLQNNAGDNLTVNADGNYTFATGLANGGSYAVTVLTQPTTPSQTCSVANGVGVIVAASITSVSVICVLNNTTPTTGNTQNIPIFGPFGLSVMLLSLLWFGSHRRGS